MKELDAAKLKIYEDQYRWQREREQFGNIHAPQTWYGWGKQGIQNMAPPRDPMAELLAYASSPGRNERYSETKCSYCRMSSTQKLCPTCGAPKA